MKIGDIIKRKANSWDKWSLQQNTINGLGIVLKKSMLGTGGKYKRSILTVYYPKASKTYTVAEKLVEIVCESR